MDVQLKRGLLEVCVLSAIRGEETYGYRIIKELTNVVEITESTLYPILRRLEAAGCLTVESAEHNGRLRKYYRLTAAGEARIADFFRDWEEMDRIHSYIAEKGGPHDQA